MATSQHKESEQFQQSNRVKIMSSALERHLRKISRPPLSSSPPSSPVPQSSRSWKRGAGKKSGGFGGGGGYYGSSHGSPYKNGGGDDCTEYTADESETSTVMSDHSTPTVAMGNRQDAGDYDGVEQQDQFLTPQQVRKKFGGGSGFFSPGSGGKLIGGFLRVEEEDEEGEDLTDRTDDESITLFSNSTSTIGDWRSYSHLGESWSDSYRGGLGVIQEQQHHHDLQQEEKVPKAPAKAVSIADVDTEHMKHHKIIGEGNFGQVWLVSAPIKEAGGSPRRAREEDPTEDDDEEEMMFARHCGYRYKKNQRHYPFALKVFSKYDLVSDRIVDDVIREKNIMKILQYYDYHPFIVKLIKTYHDEHLVYMMQQFVQGGELFSLMHGGQGTGNRGFSEHETKFYAACVTDALEYMHRHMIVYRDLKPENIMIDSLGYPVLVDFGNAKYIGDEDDEITYTLCGTPRYVAPEMIMSAGHTYTVDFWSLGILVYEMFMNGENPFYYDGMGDMELYECIAGDDDGMYDDVYSDEEVNGSSNSNKNNSSKNANCGYELPDNEKYANLRDLIIKLLRKNPNKRLGSKNRRDGSSVLDHSWFRNSAGSKMNVEILRNRELRAPWIPKVSDHFDTSHFDNWDEDNDVMDRLHSQHPKVRSFEEALFKSFD